MQELKSCMLSVVGLWAIWASLLLACLAGHLRTPSTHGSAVFRFPASTLACNLRTPTSDSWAVRILHIGAALLLGLTMGRCMLVNSWRLPWLQLADRPDGLCREGPEQERHEGKPCQLGHGYATNIWLHATHQLRKAHCKKNEID